ncbi:MAG: type II-A CRISPR-associated protein Csn2 [Olegusella sp.]|jgi:CRISPR-associated protein Csn2|nr:type II-A CRISPR-associated protein Csn2 [Olegusella sp.]
MKIVFSGLEHSIVISKEYARTVEIENKTLFSRICSSLLSCKGNCATEPYSLWDDDGHEISPTGAFLFISDPFMLPWDSKDLEGHLYEHIETLLLEDESTRTSVEHLNDELNSRLLQLTHQINGNYAFAVEWNVKRYLKAFSFSVARPKGGLFLENLNTFIDFCADMYLKKVLLFINLKEFLSEKDFISFLDHLFFHKLSAVFLESSLDKNYYALEKKMVIDQHFLEIS